jgi:hypothetical protein
MIMDKSQSKITPNFGTITTSGPAFYYPNITDFMLVFVVSDINQYLSTSSSSSQSFSFYPDLSCSQPIRKCLKNSKATVLNLSANHCLVVANPSVDTINFSVALTFDKDTQISHGDHHRLDRNKMIRIIFAMTLVVVFLII